jgi:hypothetical protein
MKRILLGMAALAAVAIAPGLAFAQYPTYYAPQPYYGAPAYQPYAAYPAPAYGSSVAPYGYGVPYGYYGWGSYPGVNWGQSSASAHGPSFSGPLSSERSH